LDYSHVLIIVIFFTHTRQRTSPFSINQLSQNTDESYFKHFIEHIVCMREISKFKPKRGRLRFRQNQLAIQETNHNQISQLYAQLSIEQQVKQ